MLVRRAGTVGLKMSVRRYKKWLVGTKKADARKTRVRRSHCDFSASADLIHCLSLPSRYVYSGKKKGMTKRETIIIITWSGTPTRI